MFETKQNTGSNLSIHLLKTSIERKSNPYIEGIKIKTLHVKFLYILPLKAQQIV